MRRNQQSLLWLGLRLGISILAVLTLSSALLGQASRDSAAAGPVISDWSNHHVVFSKPATAERAARVEQDPRYWQQIRSQSPAFRAAESDRAQAERVIAPEFEHRPHGGGGTESSGLWLQDMGPTATVGAGNYPAKFTLNVNPNAYSCTGDFVVYSTGMAGAGAQASLVAYNNLYSACAATPSVYFAYDTFATVTTSPVFWYDGTQMAVVQENTAGNAVLMLLKWKAEPTQTIIAPGRPRNVRNGQYTTCTAPCKTLFFLEDTIASVITPASDTNSSVFYDYGHDTAYVGDDLGFLHKFNPVFEGTPAEVTTGGWPVQVNPTTPTALTSPVHDSVTGNVFVEDKGGYLYSVDPLGVVIQSGQLDFSFSADGGSGFVQGPIVDSAAELVYAFASADGSGECAGGTVDCSAVYQFATTLIPEDTGTEAQVGNSTAQPATPSPMYIGAFDNAYETSAGATGHLYVCGNTGGAPTIYQIPIQALSMAEVITGPPLTSGSAATPCSPVSDVLNPNAVGGATEWLFASAQTNGLPTACATAGTGGCVMNLKDTVWRPSTVYSVGQEVLDTELHIEVVKQGGTSGLAQPTPWVGTLGTTTDGTVKWLDQGPATVATPPAWQATHSYVKGTEILDGNGNIEIDTTNGTKASGGTIPIFSTTPGGTIVDNLVTWENLGAIATAALPSAGGTSGIIIDNTISTILEPGTSQIYFSTLGSQACGTTGTGGCAVQASQLALK
jgi:hypothetical protein